MSREPTILAAESIIKRRSLRSKANMNNKLRVAAEAALKALAIAEAGLADIGDADREPGDDVEWCERRAAKALPATRDAISRLRAALEDVK